MTDATRSWRWQGWRGALAPLALVGLWLALVDTGLLQSSLLVPLHVILLAPWADGHGQQIWPALAASLARLAAGLVLGSVAGIALGVVLGLARPARRAISPTLHGLRQIALFAWIPLLTAWFGNGELAKVLFIALGAFFPVYLNTEQGIRDIPPTYLEVATVLRLSAWQRMRHLLLPAALPAVVVGLEMALLIAWISTVGAEYALGTGRGIGAFLVASREQFRMDLVLTGVLVLAVVGYILSALSKPLLRRLTPWRTS